MKKTLLILVAIVFAVTACDKETYVDGTYHVTFDKLDSHGWNAFVEFTLVEDVITQADYDYLDSAGNRKSEDAGYQDRMYNYSFVIVDGDTVRTNPETYCPQIENQIQTATIEPDFEPIDGVAGATGSSENANILMEAGLEAAIDGEPAHVILPQLVEEEE